MKKNKDINKKESDCTDNKCVLHGKISSRGRTFTGKVTKTTVSSTAKVESQYFIPIPKYERIEKRFTRLPVHNPSCINAQPGDNVKIAETRKISKTKNFVIIKKI